MDLFFRILLVIGFIPIAIVFLGSALFLLAWVIGQISKGD
jgi:hypothetical protein